MKKIYLILTITFAVFFSANAQQLDGYKICIDAGHGGHESDDRQTILQYGVVYWESEGDLETAKHLDTMLRDLGADVKLTRLGNTDVAPDDISEDRLLLAAHTNLVSQEGDR